MLRTFGQDHFHDAAWVRTKDYDGYLKELSDLEDRREHEQSASADLFGQLSRFPKLEYLLLDSSEANDKGLEYAGQHESLRTLHIFAPVELTEQGLAHLAGLEKLDHITIVNARLASLRGLDRVPNLRTLCIYNNEFTGNSLQHLQTLTQLRQLRIASHDGSLADTYLIHFAHLTQLEILAIDDTKIAEDGLRHLAALENLHSLSLAETSISGNGLRHLVDMKNLRFLTVKSSGVKESAWLRQQLPNCKVSFR